jgi:hypothetical protein
LQCYGAVASQKCDRASGRSVHRCAPLMHETSSSLKKRPDAGACFGVVQHACQSQFDNRYTADPRLHSLRCWDETRLPEEHCTCRYGSWAGRYVQCIAALFGVPTKLDTCDQQCAYCMLHQFPYAFTRSGSHAHARGSYLMLALTFAPEYDELNAVKSYRRHLI